jgi:hypothetical protein
MDRIIEEALADWNLRHPVAEEKLDAATSEWRMVFKAVLAFLRHRLSSYDDARHAHPEERERFYREVQRQAQRRYRWLRPDVDPRGTEPPKKEPPTAELLPFDLASRFLSDRYTDKARLLTYGRESKSQRERRAVKAAVGFVEQDIAMVEGLVKSDSFWVGPLKTMCKCAVSVDRYASNHRRDTRLSCPACGSRIWQIKPPVPLGQGRYWRVWVCECTFVSTSLPLPKDSRVLESKLWDMLPSSRLNSRTLETIPRTETTRRNNLRRKRSNSRQLNPGLESLS